MKRIEFSLCCLVVAVMLLLNSCGSHTGGDVLPGTDLTPLSAGYTRSVTEEGRLDDAFSDSLAGFAFSLWDETMKEGENALFSPLSAYFALSMLANGAEEETLDEIEDVLGMDVDALNRSLYAYAKMLTAGEELKIANSVWFRSNGLSVREKFLQTNADWYGAEVYSAPFDRSTVGDINGWVNENTDGMIKELLSEIPSSAVMYLINALAFDAKWKETYHKSDIQKHDFTDYNGDRREVDMLSSRESVYIEDENAAGFVKKYDGDAYSLVCLLPDEGVDVYEYARSLTGEKWLALWQGRKHDTVYVLLPEFAAEADMSLTEALYGIGMKRAFSPDAQLGGIGSSKDGNLYVSQVIQKTFIEVTREGTRAAAVTAETMVALSESLRPIIVPKTVLLERPFVYAIVDNSTGLPLFLGVQCTVE